METLQSTIFIEFDVNTKKITFLRGDNIVDYDSNITSIYVRVKYKNLSGNTVYLTPSELEDYKFSLYIIKPATNNINVITGEITDELKENVYGGVVKFEIPRACTNRLGIVKCEIHINQENKMIGSSRFVLDVKQSLVTLFDDSLLEDEDFPILRQLILEIQKGNNINDNAASSLTTYSGNKIENIKENLSSQIKEKANQVDLETERKRIDLLTKIENGQTEGNTELLDIRVGANGVIYDTAGDSVRQQFLEIDTKLNGGDLATVTQNGTYFDNFENIVGNTVKVSSNEEVNAFSYFKNLAPFTRISKSSDKITIDEETDEYIIMTIQPNATYQNIKLKPFYVPAGKYVFTRSVEYLVGNAVNVAFTVYIDYSEDGVNYTSDNRITIPSTVDQTIPTDTIGGWRHINIHATIGTPFDVETKVKLYKIGCFKSETNNYGEYEKYRGQQLKGNNLSFNYSDGMKIYSDKEVTISYRASIENSMSLDDIKQTTTNHEKFIQDLKSSGVLKSNNNIVCWGDSLTNGTGSNKLKPSTETNNDCAYPAVLGRILGDKYTVINGGVGGETSWMIAARQGGMTIQVLPNTIPADTTPVRIYLKGQEQDYFYSNNDSKTWTYSKDNLSYNIAVDGNARINPCYINGIEGTLSRKLLSSGTADPTTGETVQTNTYAYYFTRNQAGEEYTFTTPRNLMTYASKNYKDYINVIWMGQNDAPLHDGKYIIQIGTENRAKCMIEHLTHDRYIIMDLPSGTNIDNAERVQLFNQEFGKHYLNIREYICKYGVTIANELGANIIVSDSDQELINNGKIPGCLRIDGVHGNYWYYQIVARAVFEKGQDLGYW